MIKKLIDKFLYWFYKPQLVKTKPTTTILIKVGDKVIGAVQSIDITDNQGSITHNVTMTAYRTRFDRSRIEEAFTRGFVHHAAQKLPFQIEIYNDKEVTKLQNVWLSFNELYTYTNGDWIIVEKMKLVAEKVIKLFKK